MVEIELPGLEPVPQGSMSVYHGRVVQSPKVKVYRKRIAVAVRALGVDRMDGPCEVVLEFGVVRPALHYGTGRNAARVKDTAPAMPRSKPDVDKLARAVLDALTESGLWRDDSQVVSLSASKAYSKDGYVKVRVVPCG